MSKIIIFTAIGLVLFAGFMFFSKDIERSLRPDDSQGLILGKNAIYVFAQGPGDEIKIGFVLLESPGFAVVHEDQGGKPGKILGFSQIISLGVRTDLPPVVLSRPVKQGETLYAMLHLDDGDGVFDSSKDLPAIDQVGKEPVMMIFDIEESESEIPAEIKL